MRSQYDSPPGPYDTPPDAYSSPRESSSGPYGSSESDVEKENSASEKVHTRYVECLSMSGHMITSALSFFSVKVALKSTA